MQTLKNILIALFIFISTSVNAQLLPSSGGSRTGTTGFQFLKIAPDARGASMDGCMTAVADDASAMYWNPAGITKLDTQKVHLQFSQTKYVGASNLSFAALAYRLNKETVLGFSVTYFSTPVMNVTTEFLPTGNGQTFKASDVSAAITYAKLLTDNFSFGVTGKYVREDIADISSHNAVFDFGFRYDIGKANTRFAVGISNFGFTTEPSGDIARETLSGNDTINSFDRIATPTIFKIGFAWDAIKKNKNLLTLAAQLNHPTDNNETYGLGVEYVWNKIVFARSGYSFGEDEKGLPAFGFGVRFKRNFGMLQLDYGYQSKNRLGSLHRVSFSVALF